MIKVEIMPKRRRLLSWLAAALWAAMIFGFSAQPAEVSGANSTKIVLTIAQAAEEIGLISKNSLDPGMIPHWDHWLRKASHGMVYLVLAILLANALRASGVKGKRKFIYALFLCGFYAATDELHQTFVPGRAGMLSDVVIDSIGGAIGVAIYWLRVARRTG